VTVAIRLVRTRGKVLNSCVGQGWVTALSIIIMEGRGRVSVACVGDIAGGAAGGGT